MKAKTKRAKGKVTKPATVKVHRDMSDPGRFPIMFCRRTERERITRQLKFWKSLRKIDLTEQIIQAHTALAYAMSSVRMKKLRRSFLRQRAREMFDALMKLDKTTLVYILWDAKEQRVFRVHRKKGREVLGIDLENYFEFVPTADALERAVASHMRKLAEEEREAREAEKAAKAEPAKPAPSYIEYLKEVNCYSMTRQKRHRRQTARVRDFRSTKTD